MRDTKIVAAIGNAHAASRRRGRSSFALEMEQAMVAAVQRAQSDGVSDPEVVRGYIQAARVTVKDKYRRLESSRYLTQEKLSALAHEQ